MDYAEPVRGTLIAGKYRVERTLGEGGMGVVVEATHAQLGSKVAVKLLRTAGIAVPEAIARFQREARIAAQLTSDHIARVTDMGQTPAGDLFLVMELLDGHDLATELVRRGPLPVVEAVDWVLQACEALSEAHAAGLVHRDVKPANLFIARRSRGRPPLLKVLDFGLSKAETSNVAAELTQTASSFGTPQYMSPEQVRSTKHVDARSDQHAVALVLYELLAGAPAYDGVSPAAVAVSIATAPPPRVRERRPDVPGELEAAIVRALAKEPGERFPDLESFAVAIGSFGGPTAPELLAMIAAAPSSRKLVGTSGTSPIAAASSESAAQEITRTDRPVPSIDDSGDRPSPTQVAPPPQRLAASVDADEATTLDAGPRVGMLGREDEGDSRDSVDYDEAPTRRVEATAGELATSHAPSSDDPVYDMLTRRFLPDRPQQQVMQASSAAGRVPEAPPPRPGPALPPLPAPAAITIVGRRHVRPPPGQLDAKAIVLVAILFTIAAAVGILGTLWLMGRGPFGP